MKPRTKFEKAVAEINATLSEDIAMSNIEWVKRTSVEKNWDMSNFCYFTIYSNIREFEVSRLYRAYKMKCNKQDLFLFVEIARLFNDGTKKAVFAKQRAMCYHYYDTFSFHSDIELRSDKPSYCGYQISGLFKLSNGSCPENYDSKRTKCVIYNPKDIARVVRNNPVAENLYKSNDPLFGWVLSCGNPAGYCRAITLAKRHGFVFDDDNTPLWFDMVNAIMYCNKDWHNPVNIAPKDLLATHDKFMTMMDNKQDRERRMRLEEEYRREEERIKKQLERDKKENEEYIKRRKRFYDMVISDGLIDCRVLRDVQEFADEGAAMKHCVFRCAYYNKPYSLILSARISNERIETIEVDLTKYKILQCYGKHDHFTIYHNRIKQLINANMDTIKQYNTKRVRAKEAV